MFTVDVKQQNNKNNDRFPTPSIRPPSTILNDFSCETAGPIVTKFHIQPRRAIVTKELLKYSHVTNMAATPIYGKKNLLQN